jgi:hypothetical protein
MKKVKIVFILSLLYLITSHTAYSQSFKGGLCAGLSTSQVDGDTYSGYHRAGMIAGAFVNHDISEKTSLQLEIKYIQKGSFKKQNPNAGDYMEYSLRLNYIDVPLLFRFKYKNKITFETGLSFGYLAGFKEGNQNGEYPASLQKPFNKSDVGYILGGYYQLSKRIYLNIKYNYSILPIRSGINGENRFLFFKGQFNNEICFSFYLQFNKSDND